jgi:ketosteroid isomerase-like protein
MKKLLVALVASFVFIVPAGLEAYSQNQDSLEVITATQNFLSSFNNFNWETFSGSFSDDATIFFPDWKERARRQGRAEIEKTWLSIFPEFKDSANTFKMNITPKDLLIQLYEQTAIVTFHLGGGERPYLARRTIVWIKQKGQWKIAHLHASVLTDGSK